MSIGLCCDSVTPKTNQLFEELLPVSSKYSNITLYINSEKCPPNNWLKITVSIEFHHLSVAFSVWQAKLLNIDQLYLERITWFPKYDVVMISPGL